MTNGKNKFYIGVVILLAILYILWVRVSSVSDDYYDLEDRINTLELKFDRLPK